MGIFWRILAFQGALWECIQTLLWINYQRIITDLEKKMNV
jgi:hypothetical protein